MSEVIWLESQEEFETLVANTPRVVIDFSAPAWCGPCIQFEPHFEKAAEKSDVTFVAVDVDKAPWAVNDYGVMSVPTVLLYENGEAVKNLKERNVVKLLAEIG
jgi:thiol-disulfide isomerase/thioredoxin